MSSFVKDPSARLDYAFDWATPAVDQERGWLAEDEMISSYTVTAETGLTVDAHSQAAGVVTAWLVGGTLGQTYAVTCHIASNQGREDDRTIRITIRDR